MGYTHSWVPPSVATPNDLTAWKAICQDIHTQLLASGLDAAADTGQLDITAVGSLPATATFAGFKMYQFDDGVALPIFIKLEFGVGVTGLSNVVSAVNKTIRIRVTIGTTTNGSGTVTGSTIQYSCPQSLDQADGTIYTPPSSSGFSFLCYNTDRGFLGLVYQGEGGRNEIIISAGSNQYGTFSGATLVLMIQRSYDAAGVPTDDGFSVMYPDLSVLNNTNNMWTTGNMPVCLGKYYDGAGGTVSQPTSQMSRALSHTYSGKSALDFPVIFNDMNGLAEMNCLAVGKAYSALAGQEISIDVAPSITQNMMCVGRDTGLSFIPQYQRHTLFMLWE